MVIQIGQQIHTLTHTPDHTHPNTHTHMLGKENVKKKNNKNILDDFAVVLATAEILFTKNNCKNIYIRYIGLASVLFTQTSSLAQHFHFLFLFPFCIFIFLLLRVCVRGRVVCVFWFKFHSSKCQMRTTFECADKIFVGYISVWRCV